MKQNRWRLTTFLLFFFCASSLLLTAAGTAAAQAFDRLVIDADFPAA
jgi:hypothetical protein